MSDLYNRVSTENTSCNYKNVTGSGALVAGEGELIGVVVNSHTSGTIQINDGITATTAGTKATQKLTMTGVIVPAKHAVSRLTSTGAMVAGVHGSTTLTPNAIETGNYVKIGDNIYVARNAAYITANGLAAYEVSMGVGAGTDAEFLDNLKSAINSSAGVGTTYGQFTAAHPYFIATTNTDTTQVIKARTVGNAAFTAILNALGTTGTTTRTAWTATTIGGATASVTTDNATFTIGTTRYVVVAELSETSGATAVAYQVLKGAAEANMFDNILLAVNKGSGVGTNFSTGTVAHPDIIATTNNNTYQSFMARTVGNATETARINAIVTTKVMANTAWEGGTFGVGTGNSVTAVATTATTATIGSNVYTFVNELSETSTAAAIPNQILFGVDTAAALDNWKLGLTAGATVGTNYSTGTITQTQVTATTNTNTEQTIEALAVGTSYNSIATTTTLTNGTWAAVKMAGGVDLSPLMYNTITLPATSALTTFDRLINLKGRFTVGCYITVTGTVDLTFLYR